MLKSFSRRRCALAAGLLAITLSVSNSALGQSLFPQIPVTMVLSLLGVGIAALPLAPLLVPAAALFAMVTEPIANLIYTANSLLYDFFSGIGANLGVPFYPY
ncbi:hypothetical protein ACFL1X_02665 [Candidatus Hydrogenedentota bacterium]